MVHTGDGARSIRTFFCCSLLSPRSENARQDAIGANGASGKLTEPRMRDSDRVVEAKKTIRDTNMAAETAAAANNKIVRLSLNASAEC